MESDVSPEELMQMLVITAEIIGGPELSRGAAKAMLAQLVDTPTDMLVKALTRCQRECRGRLTLADILSRVAAADGRPSADEAWAIAVRAKDESETVIWSLEAEAAWGTVTDLVRADDLVAARMAFRDAYARIVADNRDAGLPVTWVISAGSDKAKRDDAIRSAMQLGRISGEYGSTLLSAESRAYPVLPAPPRESQLQSSAPPVELRDLIAKLKRNVGKHDGRLLHASGASIEEEKADA